jgi:hypothetical protein
MRGAVYGERVEDGERLRCEICGAWRRSVGIHAAKKHHITADEYRLRFGLNRARGLPEGMRPFDGSEGYRHRERKVEESRRHMSACRIKKVCIRGHELSLAYVSRKLRAGRWVVRACRVCMTEKQRERRREAKRDG